MNRFPLTLIPGFLIVLIVILFTFYVPNGGDLISTGGDAVIGQILAVMLVACIIIDYKRFKKS